MIHPTNRWRDRGTAPFGAPGRRAEIVEARSGGRCRVDDDAPPLPGRPRPLVVVTAFGAFPRVPVNASELLLPVIVAEIRRRRPLVRVESAVLATEWHAGPDAALDLLGRLRPALVLHLGVSNRARGLEVECVGRNACEAAPDAVGMVPPAGCLLDEPRQAIGVGLPTARIVHRLARLGIPARLSRDAGGYLCNAVLFHSLHAVQKAGMATRVGFVHLPASLTAAGVHGRKGRRVPLTAAQVAHGIGEIVALSLGGGWFDEAASMVRGLASRRID